MKHKLFLSFFILMLLVSSVAAAPASAQSTSAKLTCTEYHTVQRGEYLTKIARMFGVSWRWLADINDLENPSIIYPGQVLCVELKQVAPVCTAAHTVKRGEYLSKIANFYGVSWRWLAEINNLPNPNRIYTGQVLCVEMSQ